MRTQTSPFRCTYAWALLLGLPILLGAPLAATTLDAPPWTKPTSWIQTDKITPEEATEPGWNDGPHHHFASFGASMEATEGRLIVGAYGVDGAYVFDWIGNGWEQTGSIEPDTNILSSFGRADDVSIHGEVAVVGADRASYLGMTNHGAAYIYEETNEGVWEKVATVAEGEEAHEYAGQSVAVYEDTAVVGVPQSIPAHVHIYQERDGEWNRETTFFGATSRSALGGTVEIHKDTIFAGNPNATGDVNVYERTEDGWAHVQTLTPDKPTTSFGYSIDLDQDLAIIGAPYSSRVMDKQLHGTANMGKAFIYERAGDSWELVANLDHPIPIPSDPYVGLTPGARFGVDVAIQGNTAAIGAPFEDPRRTGAAYVYEGVGETTVELNQGEWELAERLVYNETYIGDWMGTSVEIDGASILVGIPHDNNRRDVPIYPFSARGHYPGLGSSGNMAGSVYEYQPNPYDEMLNDKEM